MPEKSNVLVGSIVLLLTLSAVIVMIVSPLFQTTSGKYGYIDQSGTYVIKPRFKSAHSFKGNYAKVEFDLGSKGTEEKFINKTGALVPAPSNWIEYDPKTPKMTLNDDPALYEKVGEESLGEVLINHIGRKMLPYSEGVAVARRGGDAGWGFVDKNLDPIIPPNSFIDARHFKDGLAAVAADVDENGEIISVVHSSYNPAHKKWGFVDHAGNWAIKPIFNSAECFSEGLACVSIKESTGENRKRYGFIDKTGKFVIPLKFAYAESFSDGLAVAVAE